MTVDSRVHGGESLGPLTVGSLAHGTVDNPTAMAAIDLLAHWWSRPVPQEISLWLEATAMERLVRRQLPDGSGPLMCRPDHLGGLLDEYERLFVGPGPVPCPPYESFWRSDVPAYARRSLMGPCTADLLKRYQELGLSLAPRGGELADQVTVELEAIGFALSREGTQGVARSLFSDHLAVWLPLMCHAVVKHAEQSFYRDLAILTLDWIEPLRNHLEATLEVDTGVPSAE